MRSPPRLDRIQARIARLSDRARALQERERQARAVAAGLGDGGGDGESSARGLLDRHRLARAERRLAATGERRRQLVEEEFTAIMRDLAAEAERTRAELDRALAGLAPLAAHWEEIERTFGVLDEACAAPELVSFVGSWRGALDVPEFPVREAEGYVKPFPARAFVF